MKKIICFCLIALSACGNYPVEWNKRNYDCIGILSSDEDKDPEIIYKTKIGNVVWGVILVETVVVPIWLFGYRLKCPVGGK